MAYTLRDYLGVRDDADADDLAFITECEFRAGAMVEHHIGTRAVPLPILELATLEVGADLYNRKSARNGVATFQGPDDMQAPMRIARDPMRAAYDILRPYLGVAVL